MTNNQAFTMGKLWLQWVLANTLGWFLCMSLIFVVIFSQFGNDPNSMNTVGPTPLNDMPLSYFLSFTVVAVLIGAIMGVMQWLILKQHFENSIVWLLVTTVGWSFGIIVGLVIVDWAINSFGFSRTGFVDESLLGCSIGLFSGIFQWTFLQRQVVQPGRWIIANTVGWTIAFLLLYKGLLFSFFTIGLFPGTLTGLLIIRWFCFPMDRVHVNEKI
jgi:hypothetical protein